jgi:hypothetical protein
MQSWRSFAHASGIVLATGLAVGCYDVPEPYPLAQTGGTGGAGGTGGGGGGVGTLDAGSGEPSMIDGSGALHFDGGVGIDYDAGIAARGGADRTDRTDRADTDDVYDARDEDAPGN